MLGSDSLVRMAPNDQRLASGTRSNRFLSLACASRSPRPDHAKEIVSGSTATWTPHHRGSHLLHNFGWCAVLS
jgi:hypothetical protein